ncbi:hypothetical protein [Ruegeria sp. HKCCD8929]|nr:hypothetical protein [Ruegeria sp. HKCCD8929]
MDFIIKSGNPVFPVCHFLLKPFGLSSDTRVAFLSQACHFEGHGRG